MAWPLVLTTQRSAAQRESVAVSGQHDAVVRVSGSGSKDSNRVEWAGQLESHDWTLFSIAVFQYQNDKRQYHGDCIGQHDGQGCDLNTVNHP